MLQTLILSDCVSCLILFRTSQADDLKDFNKYRDKVLDTVTFEFSQLKKQHEDLMKKFEALEEDALNNDRVSVCVYVCVCVCEGECVCTRVYIK